MAKQTVNLGTAANDGTGDPLRTAFNKLNGNFDEVYGNNFVTNAMLNNDIVDHAELADRYTAVQTISTTTATVDLDASSYGVFNITANLQSTQTLNLQNMKTGQVIDILATGTSTLTLTSDDTSETFNNLGEVTYDGASDNHIQIICIDDTDSAAIYNYTIQTYTSDNTPN